MERRKVRIISTRMASWWRMLPKEQADAAEKDAAEAADVDVSSAIDTDESKLAPFVDDETKQEQETEPTTMFSKKEKVKIQGDVPAPESPTSVDRLPFQSTPAFDSASYLKRAIELTGRAAELMTQEHLCGHAHIESPTGTLPFASNL